MFSWTGTRQDSRVIPAIKDTYPLDIAVYHSITVKVYQSLSSVHQLENLQVSKIEGSRVEANGGPTSPSLSASGCALMNSLIFPFAIHIDTIAKRVSDITTPINGRMFGC